MPELTLNTELALLVLITWVPIVVWAVATGRALGHTVAEPLFEHFGVHVRCLVARR